MASETKGPRSIVIIGGGIIGCTIAYYITRHPAFSSSTTVTVLEASVNGAAQGASGKAGGLVAKWAYPTNLVNVSFQEVSKVHRLYDIVYLRAFDKHVKLAEEHGGKDRWGWRFVSCGNWEGRGEDLEHSGTGVGKGGKRKSLEKTLGLGSDETGSPKSSREARGLPGDLTWVKEALTDSYSTMAPDQDTAQVHPYLFTTSMLELAQGNGATLTQGRVSSIESSHGRVTGVTYLLQDGSKKSISATEVIISAGAWSNTLLPSLPINTTRAHSITIRPPASTTITPYVLFTEITLPTSSADKRSITVTPEIYARPDNEVYACGPGDDSLLPEHVDDVLVDQEACESIRRHVASISPELRAGVVEKRQACFLPVVSSGGGPIIGEARKVAKGLFVATGHTCWVCPFCCLEPV